MNRNRDFRGPRGRGGRDDFGNDRRSFGDQPQPGWGEAPPMAPRAPVASGPPQDATVDGMLDAWASMIADGPTPPTGTFERITGRRGTTYEQWARDHAAEFT